MSLTPGQIELQARLTAIEHLLAHLIAMQLRQSADPQAAARLMSENWEKGSQAQTIPGIDPALSDMLADEVGRETNRILQGVVEILGQS